MSELSDNPAALQRVSTATITTLPEEGPAQRLDARPSRSETPRPAPSRGPRLHPALRSGPRGSRDARLLVLAPLDPRGHRGDAAGRHRRSPTPWGWARPASSATSFARAWQRGVAALVTDGVVRDRGGAALRPAGLVAGRRRAPFGGGPHLRRLAGPDRLRRRREFIPRRSHRRRRRRRRCHSRGLRRRNRRPAGAEQERLEELDPVGSGQRRGVAGPLSAGRGRPQSAPKDWASRQ